MTNYDDVVRRWVDRARGWCDRKPLTAREGRMYSDYQDRLFSYGSHFELGRFLKNSKGEPVAVMLNGDRYSPTTSKHQGHARGAAGRSGLPSVIVPYSALHAAGILLDTVQIVDVQPDRNVVTDHVFYEMQPAWQWRNDPIMGYVPLTDAEVEALLDERHASALRTWQSRHSWALEQPENSVWSAYRSVDSKPARPTRDSLPEHDLREWRRVDSERHLYTSHIGHRQIDVEDLLDGRTRYSWQTTRHWLGGSLLRAQVDYMTNTKCRTCNGTGWNGEPVPRTEPDWFEHRCGECNNGRRIRHRQRWAYYLSDFDHAEPRELYFFCELPRGVQPTTCAEAIEALKPDTVRMAEQMGRNVRRQGDIFAVPLVKATKKDLVAAGARIERMGTLLGTNHAATEVARMPNGQTLVRGILHHQPGGRRPDHVRVRLDGSWHVVVKNTVPISGGR